MKKVPLDALVGTQIAAATAASSRRAAVAVYGGHDHALRQTLIALAAGAELSEHNNPGEATVHVLSGRVELVSGSNVWCGMSGDFLIVPEAPHSLRAMTDAAVLLTTVVASA
ncbi:MULTISPECIES: cupin domain-containing protein [Rhodococcus]|uniref:Cupin domain-containing protein n=2 Tax=Rhodococcus TaxID=1827 RepID=A0ABU4AXR5_9NOCA|nr:MULTISPECIES: cupin domain-containing protein [Rhodococcus]KAA0925190.1 cupin domain-containing protein [Rhodococcus sp. ANT_H53B]MDV6231032.1 cupin domain-containing protein [Rhodococcus cercidiphylli]MDV6303945.1 cupin domain-containing protein [Rhodococcus cerastii]MDV7989495.1 cupin domain-containing protein [Rhodococcus sp. IEGM 1374]MDV8076535.1 cupin domain-containing protein [Rhodococcus sp. IEGM 1370]